METERYLLQKSLITPGYWVCTDTQNEIVCIFREHDFNESQKV